MQYSGKIFSTVQKSFTKILITLSSLNVGNLKNRCIQLRERLNDYNKMSLKYIYHFSASPDYRFKREKAFTTV